MLATIPTSFHKIKLFYFYNSWVGSMMSWKGQKKRRWYIKDIPPNPFKQDHSKLNKTFCFVLVDSMPYQSKKCCKHLTKRKERWRERLKSTNQTIDCSNNVNFIRKHSTPHGKLSCVFRVFTPLWNFAINLWVSF